MFPHLSRFKTSISPHPPHLLYPFCRAIRRDKEISLLLQLGNFFSCQDRQFMLAFHLFAVFLCPFLQFMLRWFKADLGCDERTLGEKVA